MDKIVRLEKHRISVQEVQEREQIPRQKINSGGVLLLDVTDAELHRSRTVTSDHSIPITGSVDVQSS